MEIRNNQKLETNKFLAYVRVSSKDQSRGTSLEEQKSYIQTYALHKKFLIMDFYDEAESAAKAGRHRFEDMIERLKKDKLQGVIFHKVDRSARNPKDQAVLYELMQQGYELHFVAEGLSTREPIGRNMMYMLWGMASGYSENLSMEINKGITGRLKQGRWPGPAPLGYKKVADCKSVFDPRKAPLVKRLFQEYATGKYSVEDMVIRSKEFGLTNKNGNPLTKNPVHRILRESFYYSLIMTKRGTFEGEHEPLVTKALFDKVQYVLQSRGFKIENHNKYIFQGLLKCYVCGRKLKAMTPKKHLHYYLCRNRPCGIKTVSETVLEDQFLEKLKELEFTDAEVESFKKAISRFQKKEIKSQEEQAKALDLELSAIESRIKELLNKYIQQKIDDETYKAAREALLNQQINLREAKANVLRDRDGKTLDELKNLANLLKSPILSYKKADPINRRRLIISMVANLELNGKTLIVNWKKPFELVARRPKINYGASIQRGYILFYH